jgi:hypothetical protein
MKSSNNGYEYELHTTLTDTQGVGMNWTNIDIHLYPVRATATSTHTGFVSFF